jgi:hypothetical protein
MSFVPAQSPTRSRGLNYTQQLAAAAPAALADYIERVCQTVLLILQRA